MWRKLIVCLLLAAAACGGEVDEQTSPPVTAPLATTTTRPGDPAVWERIEASTDCGELQREFDTAMDNAERQEPGSDMRGLSMDYAKAAENRRQELGC